MPDLPGDFHPPPIRECPCGHEFVPEDRDQRKCDWCLDEEAEEENNAMDAMSPFLVCDACGGVYQTNMQDVDDDGKICPGCATLRRIDRMREGEQEKEYKGPLHF